MNHVNPGPQRQRILVDLDGTICATSGDDYEHATPMFRRIEQLQQLHRQGHHITIWTARGSGTGEDHRALTEQQLERWGVPYDELSVGEKPVYDLIVDDRAIHPDNFFGALSRF